MPTAPLRVRPSGALLAALCLIGCAHHPEPLPTAPSPTATAKPASPPRTETLADVEEAVFAAAFASSPSFATAMGVHTHDDCLDDVSRAHFEARIHELEALLARLAAVDRAALSLDEQVDAEALDSQLRAEHYELRHAAHLGEEPDALRRPARRCGGRPDQARLRAAGRSPALASSPGCAGARVYAAGKANVQTPPREFTDLAMRMSPGSVGFFERSVATWARGGRGRRRRPARRVRGGERAAPSPRRRTSRRGSRTTCCRAPRAATRSAPSASSPSCSSTR